MRKGAGREVEQVCRKEGKRRRTLARSLPSCCMRESSTLWLRGSGSWLSSSAASSCWHSQVTLPTSAMSSTRPNASSYLHPPTSVMPLDTF